MAKSEMPHVAVLVDTATGWGRRLVRGIIDYNRSHGSWYLWIQSRGQETPISLPPRWRGEGIIARIGSRAAAKKIATNGASVVNISAIEIKGVDFPRVATDLSAAGRMGAEHLLDRGFVHFAYYGLKNQSFVNRHYRGFADAVSGVCKECAFYGTTSESVSRKRAAWSSQQKGLVRWLKKLAKPVAIVAWTTEFGREIIHACRQAGILVPEQVAVLAADDDDLLCEACTPSLSGIRLSSEQIGYKAAKLLDRMMRGHKPPKKSIFVAPTGITARQSTDTLAVDDVDLARAIAFIRGHASEAIQVSDVLRAVPVSRRLLERHFQQLLGRSPAQEIRRVRMERAKQLLAETTMVIPDVAAASGFGSPEHFARVFKSQVGQTPLKYRFSIRGH
ncbi:MAG: DNA-binding transcriptional regulator [Pirellulales bacterium]|nr:DNA-binding transcriptional regulator [Pirellulales bacterium]